MESFFGNLWLRKNYDKLCLPRSNDYAKDMNGDKMAMRTIVRVKLGVQESKSGVLRKKIEPTRNDSISLRHLSEATPVNNSRGETEKT
jgi:hypothetical protein